ncbi:hypothetical protein [Robiginitomaculum antarcticum]|uniref:hypothetical protein n=1 Tax=Robiginitomaculum antarcticum TaxID=437507 RepID=UPI00036606C9|nr:hypothetical protein [Robiginitomaculum antarcticum]
MPSVKPRIRARISPYNHNRLTLLTRQSRHSQAQIVDKALTHYFRSNEDDVRDEAFLRRLDLMTRHDLRHSQDLRVLTEGFTLFMRYFLTVMPRVNDADRGSRASEGTQHFNVFVDRLADQMKGGGYTFKNALKDVLTTDNDFFTREEISRMKKHQTIAVNDGAEVVDAAE